MGRYVPPVLAQGLSPAAVARCKSPPPPRLDSFKDVVERLEQHVEKDQILGRYHRMPKTINSDYEIMDTVLGSGSAGNVKLATRKNHSNRNKFAVKAFNFQGLPPEKRAQLESEIEVFLTMDHPHIARLTDVYESAEHMDIVMECMEGGELFDRVRKAKKFSECETADATWQMLLALNYIHSHGIMHADVKLDNFMYDALDSNHLKLIDFGFSKVCGQSTQKAFGTISYVAPEMLQLKLSRQSDLWSLGVVVFILLSGYMPFSGTEREQLEKISEGRYVMKTERWASLSADAIDFTRRLLRVDPNKRLTAQDALKHPFIVNQHIKNTEVDVPILEALRDYGHESKFRQCCLSVMAWCLTNEERSKVQDDFLVLDEHHRGTISYEDIKKASEKLDLPCQEVKKMCQALSIHKDKEIHYSDFLAAMMSKRITLNDELLQDCFNRFDVKNSGYITADSLREVVGSKFNGQRVENLLSEVVDTKHCGQVTYHEFAAYMKNQPLQLRGDEIIPDPCLFNDQGHHIPNFMVSLWQSAVTIPIPMSAIALTCAAALLSKGKTVSTAASLCAAMKTQACR